MKICKFDPATFVFPSSGPYGSIAPGQPLQCTGEKTADVPDAGTGERDQEDRGRGREPEGQKDCLRRTARRSPVIPFDGGLMQPQGIPTRDIGTATHAARQHRTRLGAALAVLVHHARTQSTTRSQSTTTRTLPLVAASSPAINKSTDIRRIHSPGRQADFLSRAERLGSAVDLHRLLLRPMTERDHGEAPGRHRDFVRMYMVPNMGHCSGGPSTDRFDFLTPLMAWVEERKAPDDRGRDRRGHSRPRPPRAAGRCARTRRRCATPDPRAGTSRWRKHSAGGKLHLPRVADARARPRRSRRR